MITTCEATAWISPRIWLEMITLCSRLNRPISSRTPISCDGIEAGGRFVEDQYVRTMDDGLGEPDALGIALRQRPDQPAPDVGQAAIDLGGFDRRRLVCAWYGVQTGREIADIRRP